VGRQIVHWGTADAFNPTNNLNPNDVEDPLLLGEQRANLMVRLDYNFWDQWTLSGVLVPIFKPLIESANLDPIHVGVIVTLQAAIGSATPPFGCDIFTAIAVFRRPYLEVIRGTPPFIFMLLIATFVLILFPQLSLWLPGLGG
jgi:TRAP-type C4-dicarboxylate transport system permease large subunit